MQTFVVFKNGEDSNVFSRESSPKSSCKPLGTTRVVVFHSQQLIKLEILSFVPREFLMSFISVHLHCMCIYVHTYIFFMN